MVVGEFDLQIPEFRALFDELPEVALRLVDVRGGGPTDALFWISGADTDVLERALRETPEIADCRHLTDGDGKSLYKVELGDGATVADLYRDVVELDGVVLDAHSTDGTWEFETFFPSREAISTFYDRVRETGHSPVLHSLSAGHTGLKRDAYGLTDRQRDTLVEAARSGYFAVPKETSLVALADTVGVSDQAASERIRRGMDKLIRSTLISERERAVQKQ